MFTARGPRLNRVTSLDNQTGWYGREQEWAGQGQWAGHGMDMEGCGQKKISDKRG